MRPDGGPAYPQKLLTGFESIGHESSIRVKTEMIAGMSLRDYFAGQAIHAAESLIVYYSDKSRNEPMHIAVLAYEIADALLKERAKP